MERYSQHQIKRAEEARSLIRKLGYPSEADVIRLINHGGIYNCPITSKDLSVAYRIFGAELGVLKGKTVLKVPNDMTYEPTESSVDSSQELHADIMFICGHPFFISVATPLDLTQTTDMRNQRHSSALRLALESHMRTLRLHGFNSSVVHSDGEGALAALSDHLQTIRVKYNPSGPNQHVPIVERKIRVLKERARCIINTLPYTLPHVMLYWLLAYCTYCINLFPHKSSNYTASPRELLLGRKVNFTKDVRMEFGEYIQATSPHSVRNTMSPRTEGAIALCPVGNIQGSIFVYLLHNRKIVKRDAWTPLPFPQEVLDLMESMTPYTNAAARGALDSEEVEEDSDGVETQVAMPVALEPPDTEPEDEKAVEEDAIRTDAVEERERDYAVDEDGDVVMEDDMDAAPSFDEEPEETETPVTAADPPPDVNTERRYNLRETRTNWRHRTFHITVRRAIHLFGEDTTRSVIREEVNQMITKGVWQPVDPRYLTNKELGNIIRSSIFLKEKFLSDGSFDKLKARLVAGGDQQDRTIFQDVSSPTVATESVMTIAAIASYERRHIATMDIGGAYLNADIGEEPVLMRLDSRTSEVLAQIDPTYKQFQSGNGSTVVKLRKALYGCVQSAKLWYQHLRKALEGLGFAVNRKDACVFNKRGAEGTQITIAVHVDDLFITCTDEQMLTKTIEEINGIFRDTKVSRGAVHSYLGMTMDFSTAGVLRVSMSGYVTEICEFETSERAQVTPAAGDLLITPDSPSLDPRRAEIFHSYVAKILYLAKRIRPELLFVISFLSSRVTCATEADWKKLVRVINYIKSTRDVDLELGIKDIEQLQVYTDASYAEHSDRKSHTGIMVTLGTGALYARSAKQKLVSKSSTEAELIALADGSAIAIWFRDFLLEQGYKMKPVIMMQDNTSTISLAEKGHSTSEKTKHIAVRYFFVKDRLESSELVLEYCNTVDMIADVLTKPLQGTRFMTMRDRLLGK